MESIIIIIGIAIVAIWILKWIDKNNANKTFPPLKPSNKMPLNEKEGGKPENESFFNNDTFVEISNALSRHFQENNIHFIVKNNGSLFRLSFKGQGDVPVELAIRIHPTGDFVTFSSLVYENVPDNKMAAAAELITRLNGDFYIGHLNLQYVDRYIEFESNIVLYDIKITDRIIGLYLNQAYNAPVKYFNLFRQVLEHDAAPLLELIDFYERERTE